MNRGNVSTYDFEEGTLMVAPKNTSLLEAYSGLASCRVHNYNMHTLVANTITDSAPKG